MSYLAVQTEALLVRANYSTPCLHLVAVMVDHRAPGE